MKYILYITLFAFLTILTQVGGIILIITLIVAKLFRAHIKNRWQKIGLFLSLYLTSTFFIIPPIAKLGGRVPLPAFGQIRPTNLMTCLLNRQYVRPSLKLAVEDIAKKMHQKYPSTELWYLDANFPFFNKFPLLPHLSHNDGKKLDISFYYLEEDGGRTNKKPAFSGYGYYESPKKGEFDMIEQCKSKGYFQYDYAKYLTLGSSDGYRFDPERTKYLVQLCATNANIRKIFIEPHLKNRLGLDQYAKVRFHGCQAVRHDDHIHIQL